MPTVSNKKGKKKKSGRAPPKAKSYTLDRYDEKPKARPRSKRKLPPTRSKRAGVQTELGIREHPIRWYRRHHQRIPSDVYYVDPKATQRTKGGLVLKHNYGPLGRPPEEQGAYRTYAKYKAKLTPYGEACLSKKKRKAYRKKKSKSKYSRDWEYDDWSF